MKKIDLGQALTLLANLGVIAGIVFLAVEIQQNSDLMSAQARIALSRDTIDILTLNISDAEYIDTINQGLEGSELTDVEAAQFRRTYLGWIWLWNNLAYQHSVGLYDDDEFKLQIDVVREDILRFPGMRRHWCSNRERNASPALIEAIEGQAGVDVC